MAVSAGWKASPTSDSWLRWWTGKEWADAYWPAKLEPIDFLPDARRFDISVPGEPRHDIVGENWREQEILAAIGRVGTPRDVEFEGYGEAELVAEPDNPFDSNAVSVRVAGFNVGYLSADEAPEYATVIKKFLANNIVPTTRVRIWGVTRYVRSRGQDELKSAIRIALAPANLLLPANQAPHEPHYLIPSGRSIQVTGEAEHLDVLSKYVQDRAAQVLVTLHPIPGKTKASGTVIEVRLDDKRIGQLTPGSSAGLLPLVNEASVNSRIPVAWATVTGSRLAAEVVVRAARAEEVPDSWPSESDSFPQLTPEFGAPIPAYREQKKLSAPPQPSGLGLALWVVGIFVALLLFAIPYVGWLLAFACIGALIWLGTIQKRRAPVSALGAGG